MLARMIRDVCTQDAARIAEIYNYYIKETVITFEDRVVPLNEMAERIQAITQKKFPYIVYEEDGLLTGYAYLNTWRTRPAYDITLEASIYLDHTQIGRGIGKKLYKELIARGRQMNLHSLVGSIALPNNPSRKLHADLGFELVGNFKESGKKFNKLIDVEFWQLFL
jgi:phosphinothricin acetyltransferase